MRPGLTPSTASHGMAGRCATSPRRNGPRPHRIQRAEFATPSTYTSCGRSIVHAMTFPHPCHPPPWLMLLLPGCTTANPKTTRPHTTS
eukprot:3960587-Pleurochrysis_carterae.AAC.1